MAHDAAGDDYGDGGDSQITYYNADGVILGTANVSTWSDGMEGGGTNTTYNGPDYNWLGNSFTDNQGSGYNFNEVLTADGDVTVTFDDNDTDDAADDTSITIADTTSYRVESGGFKPTGSETYENTYINYYNDADGSFLGGMETFGFGAEITIYGADRTVLKEAIDTEALLASFGDNLSSVSEDDLPESFVGTVLPSEAEAAGGETITATITVDENGETPVLVYDPPRDADSDFVEGNTYVFDFSAAEGYSLGLSASADNAGNNALGAIDGVTIDDVNDTLTYVVPDGAVASGAEAHLFVTKLVEADPETTTIYVKSSSPFTFYSDAGFTSPITALEFVDGNQYVFDLSGAVDAEGHPFAFGLSTSDDDDGADAALTLVYDEDTNTYTYEHTDLPETQIYVYGVDLGEPGDDDDLLVAGMGNNINAAVSQAPTPTVEEIQLGMGGASLSYAAAEPAAGPAIQTATEEFPGGGSETTYFLDGVIIGYSESMVLWRGRKIRRALSILMQITFVYSLLMKASLAQVLTSALFWKWVIFQQMTTVRW